MCGHTRKEKERKREIVPRTRQRHGDRRLRAYDEEKARRKADREEEEDVHGTKRAEKGGEGVYLKGARGEKKRIEKGMLAGGTVAHRHAIMWRLGLIYTRERRGCRGKPIVPVAGRTLDEDGQAAVVGATRIARVDRGHYLKEGS